jgi:hypothetical protein
MPADTRTRVFASTPDIPASAWRGSLLLLTLCGLAFAVLYLLKG